MSFKKEFERLECLKKEYVQSINENFVLQSEFINYTFKKNLAKKIQELEK